MMIFPVRLKTARKPNQLRLRFDLEKLRDPDLACTFQATIGGKFHHSSMDMDINTIITTYNTAVTDAGTKILWKERRRKKPRVTRDVLNLCDERRHLKILKRGLTSRRRSGIKQRAQRNTCITPKD